MPAPGAGGVQTSLVGTVQGMMASARAAFRRKPPPEQRRGAPVQSPGGDKNNPADLSQFAEDFERSREVCAVERPGSGLFRQLVLPLSGRPGRGRNAAGDRRCNGRSWSRRTRATYGASGWLSSSRAAQGWLFSLCVPRRRFGRRSSASPKASSTLRWSRSPRRLSRSGETQSARVRADRVELLPVVLALRHCYRLYRQSDADALGVAYHGPRLGTDSIPDARDGRVCDGPV